MPDIVIAALLVGSAIIFAAWILATNYKPPTEPTQPQPKPARSPRLDQEAKDVELGIYPNQRTVKRLLVEKNQDREQP